MHLRTRRVLLAVTAAVTLALTGAPAAPAATTTALRFTASDGVTLQTTLTGDRPQPTIVEFSPYGRGSGTLDPGPGFNTLLVQLRGTGDSDGRFDALGPRTQADVAEVLRWACDQPWSTGVLGLNGFSASAITIYNSLRLPLPCVKAAVLKSGTYELYRDLLSPGGVSNIVPGAGVLGLIGTPALAQGLDRLGRNPASVPDTAGGLLTAGLSVLAHPQLDGWWRERGFRGEANHLPILMIDGFYDVESRGAFQAYQALRGDGAHLVVVGAHDGAPAGTDGAVGESRAWLQHYLSGVDNGVQSHPRVQLWLSEGDRESLLKGRFARYDATDWPVPGTRWTTLRLGPARSGTAHSLNDGTLGLGVPARARQSYPALPSSPLASDPPNAAIAGAAGLNALTGALPVLSSMTLAEPLGLSYTTRPLRADVTAAGPATLDVRLATTAPQTTIWAVVSDVGPDGVPHPVASGRLSTDYPRIDRSASLVSGGRVVQPYGVYSTKAPAPVGRSRLYHVELWPIGNRFAAGHRIRLHLLGASAASLPGLPAVDTVTVGGRDGARLLLPALPGSDLRAALGGGRLHGR